MKSLLLVLLLSFCLNVYAEEVKTESISFVSQGVTLSGSLVLPANGEPRTAVIFVHGSGKQVRNEYWAQRFAQNGIAALVYDKRGAGKSGGDYESEQSVSGHNISLLASDAIAALSALQQHPRTKDVPHGITGISQAGWIAPLAAAQSQAADFLVLWSGPVCKVSEEDIYSKYTSDTDGKRVATYSEALNARTSRYIWPDFLGTDTNPSISLEQLSIPGLWVFGAEDGSIPVDLSIERLNALKDQGHNYEYVLFSNLGHNNMDATFTTVIDWIYRTLLNPVEN